jgi:hypothetical protein
MPGFPTLEMKGLDRKGVGINSSYKLLISKDDELACLHIREIRTRIYRKVTH